MYLRLRKSLVVAWLLISISYTFDVLATEKKFEISYFPEVIFKETPLTVHVIAPKMEEVEVLIDQKIERLIQGGGDGVSEVTLIPEKGIDLSFRLESGEREWDFKVIEPGFSDELREADGFLYQGAVPVILMPQHRLPPPLDRRWETVELVEHMLQNEKPEITSLRLVIPSGSGLTTYIKNMFPNSEIHIQEPDPKAWFRVHGFLTSPVNDAAEFLVVETDLFDFERGMSPQAWFMKWQFLLQNLEENCGFKDGLLFSPAYNPETLKWKSILDIKLKGLASAHGLRFVDRSHTDSVWQERLLNQLEKVYQIP